MVNNLPKKSVIVADEAVMMFFKRDFMQREQKDLLKILDICRYRNLIIIFCLPQFFSLDKHILGRIRMRAHIHSRGVGLLFKRSINPFIRDPWFQKENEKNCYDWDWQPDPQRAKGFIGIIEFGDMTKGEKKMYEPLKASKKLLREKEEQENMDNRVPRTLRLWRARFYKLFFWVCKEFNIPVSNLAKVLGMPVSSFNKSSKTVLDATADFEALQKPKE